MAARAYWRGQLRLSRVAFPVVVHSALDRRQELKLHEIHRPTGARVRHERVVPGVGRVQPTDIVMGYEDAPGHHVLLERAEIAAAAPGDTADTIELAQFIDARELDDIYVDQPFYVLPADHAAEEAYRVFQAALKESCRIGIGEAVLYRRERIVAVRPCGRGLLMETLRYAEDVRSAAPFFAELEQGPPNPRLVALTRDLIDERTAPFVPERFHDDYEAALRALIAAKRQGVTELRHHRKRRPAPMPDLLTALEASLGRPRAPAEATGKEPAAEPSVARLTPRAKVAGR